MRNRTLFKLDPESARRAEYQEMLDTELGRNRQGRGHRDTGAPAGSLDLLTRPIALGILALMFFGLTFAVLMWRDGAFDKWLGPRSAEIGEGSKGWILGRGVRERLEDTDPPPEVVVPEAAAVPAPAAVAAPAAEADPAI